MTETRLERIIKDLAGLSAEELDTIVNKVAERRATLKAEKEREYLDKIKNLIKEAREEAGIYFYIDACELNEAYIYID